MTTGGTEEASVVTTSSTTSSRSGNQSARQRSPAVRSAGRTRPDAAISIAASVAWWSQANDGDQDGAADRLMSRSAMVATSTVIASMLSTGAL